MLNLNLNSHNNLRSLLSNLAQHVDHSDGMGKPQQTIATKTSGAAAAPVDTIEIVQQELNLYGNYGGPLSSPGRANMGAPTDKLDAAFKQHDESYAKRGYFDASADAALLGRAGKRLFSADASLKERLGALGTIAVFGGVVTPAISVPVTFARVGTKTAANVVLDIVDGSKKLANSGKNAVVSTGKDVARTAANAGEAVADGGKKAVKAFVGLF